MLPTKRSGLPSPRPSDGKKRKRAAMERIGPVESLGSPPGEGMTGAIGPPSSRRRLLFSHTCRSDPRKLRLSLTRAEWSRRRRAALTKLPLVVKQSEIPGRPLERSTQSTHDGSFRRQVGAHAVSRNRHPSGQDLSRQRSSTPR
jgi:hypothetical protein